MKKIIMLLIILSVPYSISAQEAKKTFDPVSSKYGFMNAGKKWVSEDRFDEAGSNSYEGMFRVSLGKKWGFVDSTGHTVIPTQYDEVLNFNEGLVAVKLN